MEQQKHNRHLIFWFCIIVFCIVAVSYLVATKYIESQQSEYVFEMKLDIGDFGVDQRNETLFVHPKFIYREDRREKEEHNNYSLIVEIQTLQIVNRVEQRWNAAGQTQVAFNLSVGETEKQFDNIMVIGPGEYKCIVKVVATDKEGKVLDWSPLVMQSFMIYKET